MLRELIERAEKTAGSQKQLALRIGQSAGKLRQAKAGICGLPNYACVMIADLIGEERIAVIAASELVTEKKEERRKIWHPFVKHAASVLLGSVILNMTPAPSQAAPIQQVVDSSVYIMSNRRRKISQQIRSLFAGWLGGNPTSGAPLLCCPG